MLMVVLPPHPCDHHSSWEVAVQSVCQTLLVPVRWEPWPVLLSFLFCDEELLTEAECLNISLQKHL